MFNHIFQNALYFFAHDVAQLDFRLNMALFFVDDMVAPPFQVVKKSRGKHVQESMGSDIVD